MIPVIFAAVVTVSTLVVGSLGIRYAKTTANFFVASRSVHPAWNAFAICGEYMSAGSYLGLAALVVVFGADMLWLPVGWTAGYLLLLLFVAAPLRRFGAYTIPEFAEDRLDSANIRRLAAAFVLVISWLYLLPQMKGAGVVLRELIGVPFWVGVVVIGVVAALNLTTGGMRSITFVQGFQFFIIVFGVTIPIMVLLLQWRAVDNATIVTDAAPIHRVDTVVDYPNAVEIAVTEATDVIVVAIGSADGVLDEGPLRLEPGDVAIPAGTTIKWPEGSSVAHRLDVLAITGEEWAVPFENKNLADGHPVYFAYSALIGTLLGTMGLPHVLVRFYTNPDGRTARRTTVWVLALLGPYYALLPLYGALGRVFAPDVLSNGENDSLSVVVAERLVDGLAGEFVTAVIAAGAVAAMLSTSSGLLIAVAGAISHDLAGGGVRQFRWATWLGASVAIGLGLLAEPFDISILVSWAFAVAASSFCPLLVLGIWWPGLTKRGGGASMVVGGGSATTAIVATMLGVVPAGWPSALLSSPAAWSVPLAFIVGVVVSRRDPHVVQDINHKMAILHLPDRVDPDHRSAVDSAV